MDDFLYQKAKLLMQLRSHGIMEADILSAIEKVPLELFTPPALRQHSYENASVPIAAGQTISQPYVVARMTQALMLKPTHRVLEIGTGSGYQAAILAHLVRRVYTIERIRPLMVAAENLLNSLKFANILFRHSDGYKGWPEAAPFDRIIITCQLESIPDDVIAQLKPDGVLVAPVGPSGEEQLMRITNADKIETEILMPVRFVPMVAGTFR